ncbi:hypothetical protein KVG88_19090 [Pseudomonas sp. SWRI74]|uniref:Uncharacterized protein n=1 Tax=Pseudomonas azerbaijanoccidentalis TaxID=2842347 RepID=A0ABS6QTB7_9PSED|nr:hypothetical protein [Pseudomonas azerbaijanoccidentalis]MBV4522169.1 hypothetical protein [Pseudomonas azerbaijanoccidentalis]
MTDETPAARKTRLARERKQAERKRNRDKRQAMGANKLKMEVFIGTTRALEQIRHAGDFDERDHALTIVIHRVADLSRSNPAAFRKLIKGISI